MAEIILTQEIRKLGEKGDIVRVADGYARNFLFPQQMAIPATKANRNQIGEMKVAADREAARLRGDAEKLAQVLKEISLEFTERAGDSGQLFGSITTRDIAAELEKLGYTIDRHKIVIRKPIRMVGEHEVVIHLHRDVDIPIAIRVLGEGQKAVTAEAERAEAEEVEEAEAAGVAEAAAAGGEDDAAEVLTETPPATAEAAPDDAPEQATKEGPAE